MTFFFFEALGIESKEAFALSYIPSSLPLTVSPSEKFFLFFTTLHFLSESIVNSEEDFFIVYFGY